MEFKYVFLVALFVAQSTIVSSHQNDNYNAIPDPQEDRATRPGRPNSRFQQGINRDHVIEELQHQIDTKERDQMTEKELQFYYFKLHDFDNNNLLDGLEIVKALKHQHDEHTNEGEAPPHKQSEQDPLSTDEGIIEIVDNVLLTDDLNFDGYVSFHEFMSAQQTN